MNSLLNDAMSLLNAAGHQVAQTTCLSDPDAVKMLQLAARREGWAILTPGIWYAAVGFLLVVIAIFLGMQYRKYKKCEASNGWVESMFFGAMGFGGAGFILLMAGFGILVNNQWAYTAIDHPLMYVAHQAIQKAISGG